MDALVKSRKNTPKRKIAKRKASVQRGTRQNFDTQAQNQYSFLTEVFKPVLSINLPVCEAPFGQVSDNGTIFWVHGKEIKIDALKNIEFVSGAVKAYCGIYRKNFSFEKSQNPLVDLSVLLSIAQDAAPEGRELGLDYDEKLNMVVIHEYVYCDFDYNTLYFLPVSFVNRLPEDLKPLVKHLIAMIKAYYHLLEPSDHMDLSFALGIWDDGEQIELLKEEDPEQYEITKELVHSYLEGEISELISECSSFPNDVECTMNEVNEAIKKYEETKYGPLLNVLKNGIVLRDEGTWSDFVWSPEHCWIDDFDCREEHIDHSRLFAIVYDFHDEIVEQAEDCINGEAGSLELIPLYDHRILTPEVSTPFVASDFPMRWCAWFDKMTSIIMSL